MPEALRWPCRFGSGGDPMANKPSDALLWETPAGEENYKTSGQLRKSFYEEQLAALQEELVKLQYWVHHHGLRVLIIFEGRGSAGKGGVIKRIGERTSPRIVRTEALPKPTEREQTQWYFQRYIPLLPSGGEIVLFDRSWYNRSNVEWVMDFCTEDQHQEFLRTCPEFERMLVRSGIVLLKYWFSISYEEQERRFQARNEEPLKRWKLSDMDLEEHRLYTRYSMAKDTTFQFTDIKQAPWYVVPSDDKRRARLNCISHILSQIPYEDVVPEPIEIPQREDAAYIRPPMREQTFVPQLY
ncbi:MAG: polyphosphate kinase 2 [Actinomycetia bacterium]|nr:polyphosphate kinase 2 [Actinomycetes bacterium]